MNKWIIPAIAVILIAAGAFGLGRGEFSYTDKEHEGSVAGIEFSLKEKETVEIPRWATGGAIAVGTLLLLFWRKGS